MNPIILVAVVAQTLIAKFSKPLGAFVGYAVTTGMLIWGLSLYDHGQQVAVFGAPLPRELFWVWCLFWYGYDTKVAIEAVKDRSDVSATPEQHVRDDQQKDTNTAQFSLNPPAS